MKTLLFHLRELLYLSRGLRAYGRRRTPRYRPIFAWLVRMSQLRQYLRRRAMVDALPRIERFKIPEETGFLDLAGFEPGLVGEAVDDIVDFDLYLLL